MSYVLRKGGAGVPARHVVGIANPILSLNLELFNNRGLIRGCSQMVAQAFQPVQAQAEACG